MRSYQLILKIERDIAVVVGRLGRLEFPAGYYVYSGSAVTNLEARLARHTRRMKKMHWHIDYLTSHKAVSIVEIRRSHLTECALNRQIKGEVLHRKFGATDCSNGCDAHLKYLGCHPVQVAR